MGENEDLKIMVDGVEIHGLADVYLLSEKDSFIEKIKLDASLNSEIKAALVEILDYLPLMPETLSFTTETNIPKRKNKRKRIQKKWNKRYGFKLKTVVMDGFKINRESDGNFCTYETIKTI